LWLGFRASVTLRATDPDAGSMGAALVACMVATLFFAATAGFGPTTYVLSGLLVSYATSFATYGIREGSFSADPSNPWPSPVG